MLDIAILEGVRTPFAKAFGPLAEVPAQELGRIAATAVLQRAELRPDEVDQVIFGNVCTPADCANIARVIALRAGVPQDRIAHTVRRAIARPVWRRSAPPPGCSSLARPKRCWSAAPSR